HRAPAAGNRWRVHGAGHGRCRGAATAPGNRAGAVPARSGDQHPTPRPRQPRTRAPAARRAPLATARGGRWPRRRDPGRQRPGRHGRAAAGAGRQPARGTRPAPRHPAGGRTAVLGCRRARTAARCPGRQYPAGVGAAPAHAHAHARPRRRLRRHLLTSRHARDAPSPMIRVLLAEDQAMVRGALAALLGMEPDIEVAGTAADGEQAWREIQHLRPDVLVTDIELPGLTGLELAQRIARHALPVKVGIVTTLARAGFLRRALEAGVAGYLLKGAPAEGL